MRNLILFLFLSFASCGYAPAGVINAPGDHVGQGVVIDTSKIMTPAKGSSTLLVRNVPVPTPAGLVVNPSDMGAFRTSCPVSHMAFDDPITKPKQPRKSHLHVFAGNTKTDADTTAANIRTRGASTCPGGSANRSAYWAPPPIDTATGEPQRPLTFQVYYKSPAPDRVPTATVQPLPAGLRMIAGDMTNAADVWLGGRETWHFSPYLWQCIDLSPGIGYATAKGQQIPTCPPAISGDPAHMQLWATLVFPRCWDGTNLDSPDHKSHMSYAGDKGCPASHKVPLPEITFNIIYAVPPGGTSSWRLSSDMYEDSIPAGRSMHGDWFNGWNQDVMKAWIKNCVQASRDCHNELLGDGRTLYR